jgi:hypothetical protein
VQIAVRTRIVAILVTVGVAVCSLLLAGAAAAFSPATRAAKAASGGPTIPSSTVKFGFYPCCEDTSLPVVGMDEGFFKDVGINISPSNGGQFSDASQETPAMEHGTYDIATNYIPSYLTSLNTFGEKLPPTMLYDIYLGDEILKSPTLKNVKTTTQFMAEGMSFAKAAKKADAEMKGASLYTDPFLSAQPPFYNLFLSYDHMTTKDLHMVFLQDTKILAATDTPGRVDYAYPSSASAVVTLLRNGWQPMIGSAMIIKNDPTSAQGKETLAITGSSGLMTQSNMNHDTLLRFISVVYRSIAYVESPKTQQKGDQDIANLVNATQGEKLTWKDVASVYQSIDPLFGWKQQASEVWNPKSGFYAPAELQGQVSALIANGTMKKGGYSLTQFYKAKPIYYEMLADSKKAKSLIAKAGAKKLSSNAAKELAKAKQFYSWYDFLDAMNYAQAANG